MKKLLTILLLFIGFEAMAQTHVPTGYKPVNNSLYMKVVGQDTTYGFDLGKTGFFVMKFGGGGLGVPGLGYNSAMFGITVTAVDSTTIANTANGRASFAT